MKKLLIALSTLFIVACSDGDIGGYTESIIKGASAPESNASLEQQPSLLKKSSSPMDEDLSGLDEEELREKLMNSYPWPKPEGVAEPEFIDGTLPLPHNPYDGEIKDFQWKNENPSFSEPENGYLYGFDRDPTDLSPIVYVSTKEGENVSYAFNGSSSTFDYYYLLGNNENHNEIERQISNGEYSLPSDAETYSLYGCLNKPQRRQPTCYKTAKKIQIIPYPEIVKNIAYIQLNGDESDEIEEFDVESEESCNGKESDKCKKCSESDYKQCSDKNDKDNFGFFTRCCVKKYFDNIYRQAVVSSNIVKEKASDYNIHGILEINMTYPTKATKKTGEILKTATNKRDQSNGDDRHWHTVFAINNLRKIWDLQKCGMKRLKNCEEYGFLPEKEPEGTKYFLFNGDIENIDKNLAEEVDVRIEEKKTTDKSGNEYYYTQYYLLKKGTTKKYEIKKGDILFTDNGYSIYPKASGIPNSSGYTGGASQPLYGLNGILRYENYLPFGSVIMAPRQSGLQSYYLLMHELGHSFGLSDAAKTFNYWHTDKDENENIGKNFHYKNKQENWDSDFRRFTNYYASSETNVMSWQGPWGKKFRYRPTQIVCTGGKTYHEPKKDENGNIVDKNKNIIIKKGYSIDEKGNIIDENGEIIVNDKGNIANKKNLIIDGNGVLVDENGSIVIDPMAKNKVAFGNPIGTIEHRIPDGFDNNQWECIRNCYSKDHINDARLDYWEGKKYCVETSEPDFNPQEIEKAKNIISTRKIFNEKISEFEKENVKEFKLQN